MGPETKVDAEGRLIVLRSDVHEGADFEARYTTLGASGFAWLNVSSSGLYKGRSVMLIERPAPTQSPWTAYARAGIPRRVIEGGGSAELELALR